jgi:hypothetical protein
MPVSYAKKKKKKKKEEEEEAEEEEEEELEDDISRESDNQVSIRTEEVLLKEAKTW